VQNCNHVVAEDLQDKRAQLSILEQKRIRIDAQYEAERKEVIRLSRFSDSIHTEMSKINRLVAEHMTKQQELADDNFLTETEFVERLKELEADAVTTEAKIVAFKEEKEAILLDTLEGEKQIQLLEKKIALERETQAALDPEVGAAEVRAMQREIHRMRLRYAQLQKRQEMMIADMSAQSTNATTSRPRAKCSRRRKACLPPRQRCRNKRSSWPISSSLRRTTPI